MRYIIFILSVLPAFIEAKPQQDKLDSLHLSLQNAANDTMRMDAYFQLGFYYSSINTDSSNFYLALSLPIAQKLKLKLYEAGILHHQAGKLLWSNYPQALELLLQALKITEDPASEKIVWRLWVGNTPHTERLILLGYTHLNMARLYGNTSNTVKQISSLLQSKYFAESVQNSDLNMVANLLLGDVYFSKLKKLDSALYFEQRALSLFSKSSDSKNDIGWVLNTIGRIYQEKGNFDLSRNALQKGLKFMQEQNNLSGIGGICLSLSSFYGTINKPDSSLLYAYNALKTYIIFKDQRGIANAYSSLSSAYDEQKRTDSAYAYLKIATVLLDSLNDVERKQLLAYQNASFDEQIRLKNLEDQKIQTRTKIRTYALLAGIAVFMAFALLLYRNNQNRKKANELLQKQKEEIAVQKNNVEQALVELKSTQAQLIQSEKMASLGELTAGIAHEIQNPLNFVNNFSEVNTELIKELKGERLKVMGERNDIFEEEILNDISQNSEKINHHGKRADAIVKGMLQHSRKESGIKEPIDINSLCGEYLKLSYQAMRAKDQSFNAEYKLDLDPTMPLIKVIPQDIGRVLLNLFNNAFWACAERSLGAVNERNVEVVKRNSGEVYAPTVSVSTKKVGDKILISIKDNAFGIPQNIIDKIFQPFFTTKPTGQGTGLGLSLAYDIVKAHGGSIIVNTNYCPPGGEISTGPYGKVETSTTKESTDLSVEDSAITGTTFIIQLPIN